MDLADRIKNYVIPFIKDPNNKSVGKFGEYAKNILLDLMIKRDC